MVGTITIHWTKPDKKPDTILIGGDSIFKSYDLTPASLVLRARRYNYHYPWHKIDMLEEGR